MVGGHYSHRFFVVRDGRIVCLRVVFNGDPATGFVTGVFKADADEKSRFPSEPHWNEASVKWWYRKFYSETRTGQIIALREDKPELYDYRVYDGAAVGERPSANILKYLRRIHVLLWVIVALVTVLLVRLL